MKLRVVALVVLIAMMAAVAVIAAPARNTDPDYNIRKFHFDVSNGHVSQVQAYLTSHKMDLKKVVEDKYYGVTALHEAAQYGQVKVVRLLLRNGADPNNATDPRGVTALMQAATDACNTHSDNNALAMCKMLVARGATVSPRDDIGWDAVRYAVCNRNLKTIAFLQKMGGSSLHFEDFIRLGNYPKVREYLHRDRKLATTMLSNGMLPLSIAVAYDELRIAHLLLDLGADPTKQSPLNMCGSTGAYDMAKLLLEHGADPRVKNELGHASLDYATGSTDTPSPDRPRVAALIRHYMKKLGPLPKAAAKSK